MAAMRRPAMLLRGVLLGRGLCRGALLRLLLGGGLCGGALLRLLSSRGLAGRALLGLMLGRGFGRRTLLRNRLLLRPMLFAEIGLRDAGARWRAGVFSPM